MLRRWLGQGAPPGGSQRLRDPLGTALSGRSWVTLTKGPFSSLAALDLNIQSQWAPRAVCRGWVERSSPLLANPWSSCTSGSDALRCHSPEDHQRPPSAHKLGAGCRKVSPTPAWKRHGLLVGVSHGRGSNLCSLPAGPDAKALRSLGLQTEGPHPRPSASHRVWGQGNPWCRGSQGSRQRRHGGANQEECT